MPTNYHHGVRVVELTDGARPLKLINTSIIGLVATADDADNDTFPLNKAVLITRPDRDLGKAGKTGTLRSALTAISAQAGAVCVVVRVPTGGASSKPTDDSGTSVSADSQTISNVIGTTLADGSKTGMQALLSAESQFGFKPRILGIPGLENQHTITALADIAAKTRAFAYCTIPNEVDSVEKALKFRKNFGHKELMLIYPTFTAWDTEQNKAIEVNAAGYALGLRAKLDNTVGWHKVISNETVAGVTGISKDIYFNLQDNATDANTLNEAGITTLINRDGFRFWGSRTCSSDLMYPFESSTRTGQVLADSIAEGMFWAVDKPLTPSLPKDILETIKIKFDFLVRQGYLIGAQPWYDVGDNPKTELYNGKMILRYDFTPVAPLEDLTFKQIITAKYYGEFKVTN